MTRRPSRVTPHLLHLHLSLSLSEVAELDSADDENTVPLDSEHSESSDGEEAACRSERRVPANRSSKSSIGEML